jgi:hypothetical protein
MKRYTHTFRARFHHDRYRMVHEISQGPKTVIVLRIRLLPRAYDGMKQPDPKQPRPKP